MNKLFVSSLLVGLVGTAGGEPTKRPAAKTIVLVHGAFADGSSWDKVTPLLQANGYTVVAVHAPLSSLAEDVAATKREIDALPGPIILVGHSYGGAVISEAGVSDKVVGLVYVAAFVPDTGESVIDLGKDHPPPAYQKTLVVDAAGFGSLPPDTVATQFAQDIPASDARLLAAKQGPTQLKNFATPVSAAAWRNKPSWYVRAELDRMIDPAAQAMMAKRAGATVTNVKASHVPMLSKPGEVAAVIMAAASGK